MRRTDRRARCLAMVVAVIASVGIARGAHAQTPGSVLVVGTAGTHERSVVEAAISNRVRDASWSMVSRPFSPTEIDAILDCLADDRPWPCVDKTARAKGIGRLVIAHVDRPSARAPLTIKAQLLVAGNDVPAIGEGYCEMCTDDLLTATASKIADQLLKDTAFRGNETMIDVQTVPVGAIVTLDGEKVGVTNLRHRAHPGPHMVVIQRTGYRPETRTVMLIDGRATKLIVELQPTETGRDPRIVPGVVIGLGAVALVTGSLISITAEDSPTGQKHKYVYSAPGIGIAVAGGIAIGAGVYLWLRVSRSTKRSAPTVSGVPGGGAIAGWTTTF